MNNQTNTLPVATRAWMQRCNPQRDDRSKTQPSGREKYRQQPATWRNSVLIFDTETTIDKTQRLTFGCYRIGEWQGDGWLAIREEGFFH